MPPVPKNSLDITKLAKKEDMPLIELDKVPYHEIRSVWLFGKGGVLPMNEAELQAMTGATTKQIKSKFHKLKKEREDMYVEILKEERRSISGMMVSDRNLEEHKRIVEVLKQQMDEIEYEMTLHPTGSRQHVTLLKLFLAMKDQWEADTGIASTKVAADKVILARHMDEFEKEREENMDSKGFNSSPANGDSAKRLVSNPAFDI